MHPRARQLIERLGLTAHPEGGYFGEVHRSAEEIDPLDGRGARRALTAIVFLIPEGEASRWHRLRSDEVWSHLEGDPVSLRVVTPDLDRCLEAILGRSDEDHTGVPVSTVPAGYWQAATPLGAYGLVSCCVAPGFEFEDWQMLCDDPDTRDRFEERWPEQRDLI